MTFNRAIVRRPSPAVTQGLRACNRGDPCYERVLEEHAAYCAALSAAGVTVTTLPELGEFPDALFVEDTALVFSDAAILLRPGAPARRGEIEFIEPELHRFFPRVQRLPESGCADGGDVLVTADGVLIGLSTRTDPAGAQLLLQALAAIGRAARIVRTPAGVLHFKSDCALLDPETVLSTQRLAAAGFFAGLRVLLVPEGEDAAANALRINDTVLLSAGFPRTLELLEAQGFNVVTLQTAEVAKIDAGLSCMSLRWLDAAHN
ncbi:MAG: hypothetical protein JOY91_03315 [Sinobacteraceae bacterium]|nr:hypothetical protein [Nevskiaceae bacterium]